MREDPYTDDPAGLFVRRALTHRMDTLRATREVLEQGPPGRAPNPADLRRHEWYRSLDEASKEKVMEVAREVIDSVFHGVMLEFDNEQRLDEDTVWEFSLYVQVYPYGDAWEADRPAYRSFKLNAGDVDDGLLRRYYELVDEVDDSLKREWEEGAEARRRVDDESRREAGRERQRRDDDGPPQEGD